MLISIATQELYQIQIEPQIRTSQCQRAAPEIIDLEPNLWASKVLLALFYEWSGSLRLKKHKKPIQCHSERRGELRPPVSQWSESLHCHHLVIPCVFQYNTSLWYRIILVEIVIQNLSLWVENNERRKPCSLIREGQCQIVLLPIFRTTLWNFLHYSPHLPTRSENSSHLSQETKQRSIGKGKEKWIR